MKVLIINTTERAGGAAIAANRLMHALRKNGVDARMLTANKQTDDVFVEEIAPKGWKRLFYKFRFLYERLVIFVANRFTKENLFKISLADTGSNIIDHPWIKEADVLHLHWINMGFLSLKSIQKLIASGKPVIWTLHDLWPVTGICHYPGICDKYETGCYACPYQPEKKLIDLVSPVYNRKKSIGLESVHFNGCSRWIMDEARKSGLAGKSSFGSIPNAIDTVIFSPQDREKSCHVFNLDPGKKYLLFVADNINDQRKGVRYLIDACRLLQSPEYAGLNTNTEILLLGKETEDITREIALPVHSLGYLNNDKSLADAYSCADVFVIPSLEDNLPNTILEAMACATPCVGFDTGGIPEMINHLENGYIASKGNTADLAKGISWVLNHPEKKELNKEARIKITTKFNETVIASQFINLYKQIFR